MKNEINNNGTIIYPETVSCIKTICIFLLLFIGPIIISTLLGIAFVIIYLGLFQLLLQLALVIKPIRNRFAKLLNFKENIGYSAIWFTYLRTGIWIIFSVIFIYQGILILLQEGFVQQNIIFMLMK
jgi:hypothetical protein